MRQRILSSGVVCGLVLVAGCMVGPNYHRPETSSPGSWCGAGGKPTATQPTSQPSKVTTQPAQVEKWWKNFNDPELNSLLERAVAANLDLQIAMLRIREARAQRGIIAADLYPQVNVGGSYSYSGSSQNAGAKTTGGTLGPGKQLRNAAVGGALAGITGQATPMSAQDILIQSTTNTINNKLQSNTVNVSRDRNLFEAGFDASWELDVFGGNRRAVEAADANVGAAVESERDVLVTLMSEVAVNYIQLRGAQQRLIIARENIRIQQDTLELTQEKFRSGFISQLDVTQAQAQLATTKSQVPILETTIKQAIYQISLLLAQQPCTLLTELEAVKPIPLNPPEVPVGLPSDILRRRPDIRLAERQLAAATAEVGSATADLFPKFSLTGSIGPQSREINHILDQKSFAWSVGPGVTWPVFDGWRIRSNIELKNALQAEAAVTYEKTVLDAFREVESNLVAYQNEQVRHQQLKEAVAANQQSTDLSQELYTRGLTAFLNVLSSQQSLYNSQDALVQSQVAATTNLIALYKALGGGWEEPPGEKKEK